MTKARLLGKLFFMKTHTKILIATTKPYWMPKDELYIPVLAGSANNTQAQQVQSADKAQAQTQVQAASKAQTQPQNKSDILTQAQSEMQDATTQHFTCDDTGENISAKNARYCELTALYWGWKNIQSDYLGLVHYRRHFKGTGARGVLQENDLETLLEKAPVIVPKKRNYYIETVQSHYAHTFDGAHLEVLRSTLKEKCPEYISAFDELMQSKSAHIYNMFIMREDILDAYCNWLFDVLFACEEQIDFSNMSAFEQRVMGRLSERLLDTWLNCTHTPYVECGVQNLEHTNWLKKGGSFLAAKFLGKRYTKSF